MEQYKFLDNKKWRYGYTTGTCAAAAAKAAAAMLLSGGKAEEGDKVEILTPKGTLLSLVPEDMQVNPQEGTASCAIRKDSGDDPDITNGILIYARVEKRSLMAGGPPIVVEGGKGVGRVTKPGLNRPVGEAAINETPLKMIEENVQEMCHKYKWQEGLYVEIYIPDGERLALKTFNPKLGITGGISVLGTTGIVEPMSDDALVQTIRAQMSMFKAAGRECIIAAPGNYGKGFLKEYGEKLFGAVCGAGVQEDQDKERVDNLSIKCSNFIGDTLDMAMEMGFKGVLFTGHIGKLIKLASGNMNTHSKWGDPRIEILTSYAAVAGADQKTAQILMDSATTEQALQVLIEKGIYKPVLEQILLHIQSSLDHRCQGNLTAGCVLFSSKMGVLGRTRGADLFMELWDPVRDTQ